MHHKRVDLKSVWGNALKSVTKLTKNGVGIELTRQCLDTLSNINTAVTKLLIDCKTGQEVCFNLLVDFKTYH